MVEYKQVRDRYKMNMNADSLQTFRNSMNELSTAERSSLVNTDDLKRMVHIASNDDDIRLLEKLLSKCVVHHVR